MSRPAPYSFSFEPLFLAVAVVLAVFYIRAARRERPPTLRAILFALGVLLLASPLNSPLETLAARYLLLIHLLQNVMIADWAPPLLILGLTPSMGAAVRRVGGRWFARVTQPHVALPLWLVVWYGVHAPQFYDWALRHNWPLNLEHALLVVVGLLFWWPVFEPSRRTSTPVIIVHLGIAFVTAPFLSLAYIFSSRAFYSYYAHGPRLWGLSAVKDQNLAGILMNAEQTAIFFLALSYFVLKLLQEEEDSGARTGPPRP